MKTKKYKFLIPTLFSAVIIIIPFLVWAVGGPIDGEAIFQNPLAAESLTELLVAMLDVLVQVGLVIIVFFIIFAGFKYVTAQGDTNKIKEAHTALVATLIGSAIVLGSYAIASALKSTVEQLEAGVVQLEENINFKV